jgi:outer membrane scaffolding protein for murein synthesis (MipA/OmpV family)
VAYSLALDLNSRRRKDDSRFAQLADVKEAAAARVEIEQDLGALTLNATLQNRFGKASEAGTTGSLEASYALTQSRDFLLSAGINAKLMDGRFARNFFGVSAAQATASGLPAYAAAAGVYRAAPFVQVLARIDDDWTFFGRLEAGRLRGDAAGSPLVRQARGDVLVLSASRTF